MLKSSVLTLILISGLFIASQTVAQTSSVDPGISTHNYKHPNKAAKAKAAQNTVRVSNLSTVERYTKARQSGYVSSTPKYAPRPASLVLVKSYEVEKVAINPLQSDRNYKTASSTPGSRNSELANVVTQDSVYPNRD